MSVSRDDTLQVKCRLCDSDHSRLVWRQNGSRIERCGGCGVLFAVNPPSQTELNALYEKGALIGAPTDDIGRENGPPPEWKQREQMSILRRLKQFGVSGSLLDVGAFDGMFMNNAKRAGFDVAGVEPLREAYQHVSVTLGLPVTHGDLHAAVFQSERFAAVSLLDVIEHVYDPIAELREVRRVLKPGGVLVMTTPNAAGLLQRIVGAKRKMFGQPWCPIDDIPWHLWGFTPRTIRLCAEKAGFQVDAVHWLEPSPLSSNRNSGSTAWKKLALRAAAEASKLLRMSDRMVVFARKGVADRS
jgi:SAM-dependent methyltransferase